MPFVTDGDELTDIIRDLEMMSFIEKPAERSNRVLFTVNRLMRDYVIGQANYRLSPAEHASVYHRANMRPAEVASPSVRIEIEKAITSAQDLARYDRDMAIAELEKARGVWGDDPRLLEQLGYLYFRVRQRGKARMLLEMAVGSGYESAGLYVELALVLYHDRDFDNALRYAERALVLKRHFPLAELVAGESLVDSCSRSSFMLSSDEKIRMLERAREHLRRSLVYPSRSKGDEGQNARASNFLRVAEREIDRLRQAEAVADRGRRR